MNDNISTFEDLLFKRVIMIYFFLLLYREILEIQLKPIQT